MGATFYFLLAGHPPFPTGTVSQKLLWHRTKEPTAIRAIRPEVPDGLAAIVSKMMAKDPKARYQTPSQVVAELDAWMPASVPLPDLAEMPQLSPAASEGIIAESEVDEQQSPVVVAAESLRSENPYAAIVGSNQSKSSLAPQTPFGPSPGSPWGNSGSDEARPNRQSMPAQPQSAIDTVPHPSEQTPTGQRRNPFANTNPFAGGDVTVSNEKPTSWALIAVMVMAVTATVALAAFKLFS
jgi:serine/threonine protein kinase